jgi:hypothetical protein
MAHLLAADAKLCEQDSSGILFTSQRSDNRVTSRGELFSTTSRSKEKTQESPSLIGEMMHAWHKYTTAAESASSTDYPLLVGTANLLMQRQDIPVRTANSLVRVASLPAATSG